MDRYDRFREELESSLGAIRAFARTRTRNREQAEDLVSDTIVEALKKQDSFELGTKMNSWLFQIMVNLEKNMRRRQKVADNFVKSEENGSDGEMFFVDFNNRILIRQAGDVIEKLPVEQKSAMYLIAEGHSYEEIGKILDCSVGAAKSRVMRAREFIAHELNYELSDPKKALN